MTKTNKLPGKTIGKNEMKAVKGGWGRSNGGGTPLCLSNNQLYVTCPPVSACPLGCIYING